MSQTLSTERSARLRELVEGQGMTVPEAAAVMGIARRSADYIATRAGIVRPVRIIPAAQLHAATAASAAKAHAVRAELAERLKTTMAQHGLTLLAAAKRLGIDGPRAYRIKAEFKIPLNDAARSRAASEAQKRRHAENRGRDGALLAEMVRLRPQGLSVLAVAKVLKIGDNRARAIWTAAHPGMPYSLNGAGRYRKEVSAKPDPLAGAYRVMNAAMNGKHPSQMTEEERGSRDAAIAHAKRTAVLPPVQEDEAARLVAEFMARRGVTRCEPGFAAPINCGTGL